MFAYRSRTDKQSAPNLAYIILQPERVFKMVKTPKTVLSSSPSEGVSCISENNNDRRTAPKSNLLFRGGDYRKS